MARRARVLAAGPDHAQALRDHLVAVTQRLLAAHGLSGLTTRTIAREAQVADGVLYNHFADKDDLVVSALVELLTGLGRRFSAACPRPGEQDLAAGLTTLVEECRRFQVDAFPVVAGLLGRPDLLHALFGRLHEEGGPFPPLVWGDVLGYLAGEQARGVIAADVSLPALAATVFGATQLDTLLSPDSWAGTAVGPAADAASPAGAADLVPGLVDLLVRACRP